MRFQSGTERRQALSALGISRFRFVYIGIAILAAFYLIGLLLYPAASEKPKEGVPPNPFANPEAGKDHIKKLAQQYGSDFDRLSEDDKTFLNTIAMGHGRELLAKTVRELKSEPHKASDPAK